MIPIYEMFIDKYIMSDDMKKYLDENSLGASGIEDMIYYSPAPGHFFTRNRRIQLTERANTSRSV